MGKIITKKYLRAFTGRRGGEGITTRISVLKMLNIFFERGGGRLRKIFYKTYRIYLKP